MERRRAVGIHAGVTVRGGDDLRRTSYGDPGRYWRFGDWSGQRNVQEDMMGERMDQDESVSAGAGFVTGLIAGGLVGAGLGLFFAPRRGSELRKQVADSATNVGQAVTKTVDEWSEQGRAFYDRVRDVASHAGEVVDRMTNTVAGAAEKVSNQAGSVASTASSERVPADRG
jgi:gas vesicle protein